jgi:hypothetical protein
MFTLFILYIVSWIVNLKKYKSKSGDAKGISFFGGDGSRIPVPKYR